MTEGVFRTAVLHCAFPSSGMPFFSASSPPPLSYRLSPSCPGLPCPPYQPLVCVPCIHAASCVQGSGSSSSPSPALLLCSYISYSPWDQAELPAHRSLSCLALYTLRALLTCMSRGEEEGGGLGGRTASSMLPHHSAAQKALRDFFHLQVEGGEVGGGGLIQVEGRGEGGGGRCMCYKGGGTLGVRCGVL